MLQSFFRIGMRAPARHLTFRRTVVLHVFFLACLGWVAIEASMPPDPSVLADPAKRAAANSNALLRLSVVGQLTLILGIVEGAALVGWRLTQLPKSQALEFLLVSPLRPPRVFLAELLVGIGRFALVTLAGLPILLGMVLLGAIDPTDLWPLVLLPFIWGIVAALALTVWAYEPLGVRRVCEVIGMMGILFYLIVGLLAGEKLRFWLVELPPTLAEWAYRSVMWLQNDNPFGLMRNWFRQLNGPNTQWPLFVEVNALGLLAICLLALRGAFRLRGHFHDRHYKPLESDRLDQSEFIGERPLSWWAVRRVMEYSGRINVWLAGGFSLLYASFIVADDNWPSWMGRAPFMLFESWGGGAVVALSMCVLAAVPAAFQFGLWDPTISDRCKRLELLLLTELTGDDYWHASLTAAWHRGRSYLGIAVILWVALALSGRVAWYEALAAALGGFALWGFSFAVGFQAFSRGNQAGGIASGLTLGLPFLLFALMRANLEIVAAFVPTAACYLPLKSGITWYWASGLIVTLVTTWWLTHRGRADCDTLLRRWYDANQGRKAE